MNKKTIMKYIAVYVSGVLFLLSLTYNVGFTYVNKGLTQEIDDLKAKNIHLSLEKGGLNKQLSNKNDELTSANKDASNLASLSVFFMNKMDELDTILRKRDEVAINMINLLLENGVFVNFDNVNYQYGQYTASNKQTSEDYANLLIEIGNLFN